MGNKFIGNKGNDILGGQDSLFEKVVWSESKLFWKLHNPNQKGYVTFFDDLSKDTSTYDPNLNFSTVGNISSLYSSSQPQPTQDYWQAYLGIDSNKRIYLSNVVFKGWMPEMNHVHTHPVMESLGFHDLSLTLQFKKNNGSLYYYEVPLPGRDYYRAFRGTHGMIGDDVNFHLGILQNFTYYIKVGNKLIGVRVDLSIVFKKPDNDFEPLGVIDASKIFPQITFHSAPVFLQDLDADLLSEYSGLYFNDIVISGLPSDVLPDTATVYKYKGRIKLVVDTNNAAHVNLYQGSDGKMYDADHFKDARDNGISIPDVIEKVFHPNAPKNLAGFYTDCNVANKDRKYPAYHATGAVPPTWAYIFDYKKLLQTEQEIRAVYGYQDSDFFNVNTNHFPGRKADYIYPSGNTSNKKISLVKEPRQGEYDNIHLHGYMGHYKDNDKYVLHAPICGFCCFHLHWRWSELNYNLNSHPINRILASGNPDRFKGWGYKNNQGPNSVLGAPLIPPNQSLKIAITNPTTVPYDSDYVLNPSTGTGNSIDPDKKAIWYSCDVLSVFSGSKHVVLEQGTGFAFRYNQKLYTTLYVLEKIILNPLAVTLPLSPIILFLQQITPNVPDYFEVGYRLMQFFNNVPPGEPYKDHQQVPDGDYNTTNPKTMAKL